MRKWRDFKHAQHHNSLMLLYQELFGFIKFYDIRLKVSPGHIRRPAIKGLHERLFLSFPSGVLNYGLFGEYLKGLNLFGSPHYSVFLSKASMLSQNRVSFGITSLIFSPLLLNFISKSDRAILMPLNLKGASIRIASMKQLSKNSRSTSPSLSAI